MSSRFPHPSLRTQYYEYGLQADDSYWMSSPNDRAPIGNGAGAADGIKVPVTMWGCNVREAFDIHDWDYERGGGSADRLLADNRMLLNIHALLEARTTRTPGLRFLLLFIRGIRANTYYRAVRDFGRAAFSHK